MLEIEVLIKGLNIIESLDIDLLDGKRARKDWEDAYKKNGDQKQNVIKGLVSKSFPFFLLGYHDLRYFHQMDFPLF